MSDVKYEVIQWVEGGKRPSRLGYAKSDGKGGFYVNLTAGPIMAPGKYGTVELRIQEQRPYGENQSAPPSDGDGPSPEVKPDDIPF